MMSTRQRVGTVSRRRLLRLGVGAAASGGAAAVTSGCAGLRIGTGSDGRQLDFFWYVEGKRSQYTRAAARRYERAHAGVTIDARFTGYADYWDKLATQVAGGDPPDVFQLELVRLNEYAARGVVRPLDDLVPDLVAALEPDVKASCTYDGRVYFLPTGLSVTPGLTIDRDAVQRLGLDLPAADWTMADFVAFCQDTWTASKGTVSGTSDLGGNHWALEAYALGRGEQPFDADGRLGMSRDTVATWLRLWDRLRRNHSCVPMDRTAEGAGFENSPIVTGDAVISDTASAKGLLGLQSLTKHRLGLVTFPRAERGGPTATTVPPIEWWAISSRTDDKTARLAASFCRYLLTGKANLDGMVAEHGIPVVPSLRAPARASAAPEVKVTFDAFDVVRAAHPPAVRAPAKGASELLTQVLPKLNEDVGFDRTTVSRAARDFFAEADRILGAS